MQNDPICPGTAISRSPLMKAQIGGYRVPCDRRAVTVGNIAPVPGLASQVPGGSVRHLAPSPRRPPSSAMTRCHRQFPSDQCDHARLGPGDTFLTGTSPASCTHEPQALATVRDRLMGAPASPWNESWNEHSEHSGQSGPSRAHALDIGAGRALMAGERPTCKRQVSGSNPLTGSQVHTGSQVSIACTTPARVDMAPVRPTAETITRRSLLRRRFAARRQLGSACKRHDRFPGR
jgi:hypothetical protein